MRRRNKPQPWNNKAPRKAVAAVLLVGALFVAIQQQTQNEWESSESTTSEALRALRAADARARDAEAKAADADHADPNPRGPSENLDPDRPGPAAGGPHAGGGAPPRGATFYRRRNRFYFKVRRRGQDCPIHGCNP